MSGLLKALFFIFFWLKLYFDQFFFLKKKKQDKVNENKVSKADPSKAVYNNA